MFPIKDPNDPMNNPSTIDFSVEMPNGFFGNLFRKWSSSGLTGAEQEANAFSAYESQLNRQFQANQAQLARDWQEEMYNQYYSPAAQVNAYKQAGLNPALMYGRGASTPSMPSTSSPSGNAASSISPAYHDIFNSILQLGELANRTRLSKSQSSLFDSQSYGMSISNAIASETKEVSIDTAYQNLNYLKNNANRIAKEVELLGFEISRQDLVRSIMEADKVLKQSQGKLVQTEAFFKKLEQDLWQEKGFKTPPSILVPVVSAGIIGGSKLIESVVSKIIDWRKFKLTPKKPIKTGQTMRDGRRAIHTEYHYE